MTRQATFPRRHMLLGLLTIPFVLACQRGAPSTESEHLLIAWPKEDRWPPIFYQAAPETQEAYRYAVMHPEILQYFPCYCGCVDWGHRSNLDCYVKQFRADGSVVLDPMSFG